MSKSHTTLTPATNVALIFIWGAAVVTLLVFLKPWPIYILGVATVWGVVGGFMQVQSFKESKESFKDAKTMLEVRASFKSTTWGKRYLYFLWAGHLLLVAIAFTTTSTPFLSVLLGYFLLMSFREAVTLKPSMLLGSA